MHLDDHRSCGDVLDRCSSVIGAQAPNEARRLAAAAQLALECFEEEFHLERHFVLCVWLSALVLTKTKQIRGMSFLLMGVSACGKTTLGKALAEALALPFFDADEFHPGEKPVCFSCSSLCKLPTSTR